MPSRGSPSSGDADDHVASSTLVDPCQQRILSILLEHSRAMTDRDIALQLAARETDTPPSDVAETDLQRRLVDLHHRYVPKLEALGLIERHPEGIVAAERLRSGLTELLLSPGRDPDIRRDTLTAVLARPRRQYILTTLAREDQPRGLDELAAELPAREQIPETTVESGAGLPLPVVLHHVDLPRLDEAGLIEYDRDEKTITPEPALATIVAWIDDGVTSGFTSPADP